MGNYLSNQPSKATVKVILYDGKVEEYNEPITVAELMLEHPQHVVVELEQIMSNRRPDPLPADRKLETKKVYVMVPMQQGKLNCASLLSTLQANHVILSSNSSILRPGSLLLSSSKYLSLFAGMFCSAGVGVLIQKEMRDEEKQVKRLEFLCESLEEKPEFLSRQISVKGWKPSLDTIKEKKVERRVPHWLSW